MVERSCPVCGEPTTTAARFCSACGVDLQAQVILDPVAPPEAPESVGERRSLSMLLVPLGVVVAIGLAVLFLVSGGDDDPEPETSEGIVGAPTATPLPTATATPIRVTLPERTPIQPTPTRTPSLPQAAGVDPADVSLLPLADATHLAVAHDRDLAYLDLATGEWIIHERVNLSAVPTLNTLRPFANGVISNDTASVLYVPVDGRPVVIAEGYLLGARGDVIYVQEFTPDGESLVHGFDTAGEFVEDIDLPALTSPAAMLPSGELVVEGGGRIFLVGAEATTILTEGRLLGVSGTRILTHTCLPDFACSFDLIDMQDGSRIPIDVLEDTVGTPSLVAGDRIVLYDFPNDPVRVYRIEESGVVFDEEVPLQEANFIAAGFGEAIATDTTGLYARVDGGRLLFHGPTGDEITEVALDFLPGFGDTYSLAFVTADS